MGLFDLLRGYASIGPEDFALNPDNWAPSLFDPPALSRPMPAVIWQPAGVAGPTPAPIPIPELQPNSMGATRWQSLSAINPQVGLADFALNPDNWTLPLPNSALVWPRLASGYDPAGGFEFGLPPTPQQMPHTESRLGSATPWQSTVPADFPLSWGGGAALGSDGAARGFEGIFPQFPPQAIPQFSDGFGSWSPLRPDSSNGHSPDLSGQGAAGRANAAVGDGASLAGHAALTAGSFIPGPIGSIAALGDAGLSLKEGDWLGAGIGGAAALAGIVSDAGAVEAALKGTRLAADAVTAPGAFNRVFDSFREMKRYLGSPGEGNEWHHIVEQSKIDQFGPQAIHRVANVVAVPEDVHHALSGFYSSVKDFSEGQRVRDWLRGQPFEQQYQFGLEQLEKHLGD